MTPQGIVLNVRRMNEKIRKAQARAYDAERHGEDAIAAGWRQTIRMTQIARASLVVPLAAQIARAALKEARDG